MRLTDIIIIITAVVDRTTINVSNGHLDEITELISYDPTTTVHATTLPTKLRQHYRPCCLMTQVIVWWIAGMPEPLKQQYTCDNVYMHRAAT